MILVGQSQWSGVLGEGLLSVQHTTLDNSTTQSLTYMILVSQSQWSGVLSERLLSVQHTTLDNSTIQSLTYMILVRRVHLTTHNIRQFNNTIINIHDSRQPITVIGSTQWKTIKCTTHNIRQFNNTIINIHDSRRPCPPSAERPPPSSQCSVHGAHISGVQSGLTCCLATASPFSHTTYTSPSCHRRRSTPRPGSSWSPRSAWQTPGHHVIFAQTSGDVKENS